MEREKEGKTSLRPISQQEQVELSRFLGLQMGMSVREMMNHTGFPDVPIIDIMRGASERVLFEGCMPSKAIDDEHKFQRTVGMC